MTKRYRPSAYIIIVSMWICCLPGVALGMEDRAVSAPSLATTEASWEPLTEQEYRQIAEARGVGFEQARTEYAVQSAISSAANRAARLYPDSFAGSWLDDNEPAQAFLAFTNDAEQRLDVAAGDFPVGRQSLHAVEVDRSLAELEDLKERLAADPRVAERISALGLDLPSNRVKLVVRDAADVAAELEQHYDLADLQIESGQSYGYSPLLCGRSNCRNEPMRGGLEISSTVDQNRFTCTSGFTVGIDGDFSFPGVLTAGHCTEIGQGWNHGPTARTSEFLGIADRRADFPEGDLADAAAVELTTYDPGIGGWVYVNRLDKEHSIRTFIDRLGYQQGGFTCWSGSRSGYQCTEIADTNYSLLEFGIADAVLTDSRGCDALQGDSGAPVFDGTNAHGIVSGEIVTEPPGEPSYCVGMLFSKIENVMIELDVTLLAG